MDTSILDQEDPETPGQGNTVDLLPFEHLLEEDDVLEPHTSVEGADPLVSPMANLSVEQEDLRDVDQEASSNKMGDTNQSVPQVPTAMTQPPSGSHQHVTAQEMQEPHHTLPSPQPIAAPQAVHAQLNPQNTPITPQSTHQVAAHGLAQHQAAKLQQVLVQQGSVNPPLTTNIQQQPAASQQQTATVQQQSSVATRPAPLMSAIVNPPQALLQRGNRGNKNYGYNRRGNYRQARGGINWNTSNQQHRFNQNGQGNFRGANNWGHTTGQQHPHNYNRSNRTRQGKRDRSPDPTDDAQSRRRIRMDLELYIAEKHGLRPSNSLTLEQLVSELKSDK